MSACCQAADSGKRDQWAESAQQYAASFETLTIGYGVKALQLLGLAPGAALIDVGCGPGALAVRAAQEFGAVVEAIDTSEAMIALSRARAGDASASAKVNAQVMDGQALSFDDNTFDAAISSFGVFLFPKYKQGLREMYRTLRVGGRAAVVSWCPPLEMSMAPWWELIAKECPEATAGLRPAGWVAMDSEAGLVRELKAAGFAEVRVVSHQAAMDVTSAANFVAAGAKNPVVQIGLKQVGSAERRAELLAKLVKELEDKHGKGPFQLPTRGLIAIGTKA